MTDGAHDRSAGSGGNKAAERNGISGQERPVLVAVDLGAESCRVSLLRWIDGQPEIRLVHRFANSAKNEGNGLRWDIGAIVKGVEEGLRACAQLAPEGIAAIGVDGWAVDYVRLEPEGKPVGNPFCYRDERTLAALKACSLPNFSRSDFTNLPEFRFFPSTRSTSCAPTANRNRVSHG